MSDVDTVSSSLARIDLSAASSSFEASRDAIKNLNSALLQDEEFRTRVCVQGNFIREHLRPQILNTCRLVRALLFSFQEGSEDNHLEELHPREIETFVTRIALCNTLWRTLQIACTASRSCQKEMVTPWDSDSSPEKVEDENPEVGGESDTPALHISLIQTLTEVVAQLQPPRLSRVPKPVSKQLRNLVLTGFRTLCNLTTQNPETQAALWLVLWSPAPQVGVSEPPKTLLDTLITGCQDEGPLESMSSFLCHLLYICVWKSPERVKELLEDS